MPFDYLCGKLVSMLQHFDAIYENGVLKPLQPIALPEHQRVRVSVDVSADSADASESFFDAANRIGVLGCVKGTPSDLSTNKAYFEGFGKRDA